MGIEIKRLLYIIEKKMAAMLAARRPFCYLIISKSSSSGTRFRVYDTAKMEGRITQKNWPGQRTQVCRFSLTPAGWRRTACLLRHRFRSIFENLSRLIPRSRCNGTDIFQITTISVSFQRLQVLFFRRKVENG